MSNKSVIVIIIVLLAVVAWWFLHEDPEAEVRDAHQELSRLLSKTEGDASTTTTIFNARALQGMFANSCEVTGDAEMFAGRYTPEEMVSLIIQVQGVFLNVELTFHELEIEFPAADDAIANFTAVLVGKSVIEGEEEAAETRAVVSRMHKVEGDWLFAEFKLAKVIEK